MKIATPLVIASLTLASSSTLAAPLPNSASDGSLLASPNPEEPLLKSPSPTDSEWFSQQARRSPLPSKKGKRSNQKRNGGDPSANLPPLSIGQSLPDTPLSGLGLMSPSTSLTTRDNMLGGAPTPPNVADASTGAVSGLLGSLPPPVGPLIGGVADTAIKTAGGLVVGILPAPVGDLMVGLLGGLLGSGSSPLGLSSSTPAKILNTAVTTATQTAFSQGSVPITNAEGKVQGFFPMDQLPPPVQQALAQAQRKLNQEATMALSLGDGVKATVGGQVQQTASTVLGTVSGKASGLTNTLDTIVPGPVGSAVGVAGGAAGQVGNTVGSVASSANMKLAVRASSSSPDTPMMPVTSTASALPVQNAFGMVEGKVPAPAAGMVGQETGMIGQEVGMVGQEAGMVGQEAGMVGSTANSVNPPMGGFPSTPANTVADTAQAMPVQNVAGTLAGKVPSPVPASSVASMVGSITTAAPNPQRAAAMVGGSSSTSSSSMMTSTTTSAPASTSSAPYAVRVRRLLDERRELREREEAELEERSMWDDEDDIDDDDNMLYVMESGDEKFFDSDDRY